MVHSVSPPAAYRDSRVVCIDRMYFDENGYIKPVKITFEGVKPVKAPKK